MPGDDTLTDESRSTGTRDRSPLTWLVAVAVVLLIAGATLFGLLSRGGDEPGSAADTTPNTDTVSEFAAPSRTTLTARPDVGRCIPPNVGLLRRQTLAFDGVVRSVIGGEATLEPTRFYAGQPTDVVIVNAPDRDLQALLAAVDFQEGERYLVAATDGRLTLCGFSGPYTTDLADLYAKAYGS